MNDDRRGKHGREQDREHHELAEWDAAYVLGALSPSDRRRFEEHLETCPRCREAVAELASMPGLLARAGVSQEPESAAPPADLLDRMRARERGRRRARRLRVTGLAAAAVLAVALAIGVPLVARQLDRPEVSVALQPVEASEMTVDVGLDPVAWGTRLSIRCDYPEGFGGGSDNDPWTYQLVLTDVDGTSQQVSTWGAVPGRAITLQAGTALPMDRIASLEVRTGTGDTLMSATLPVPE